MYNLSLYELSSNYLHALDALTDPEADIPMEAVTDTLEGLEGELQEKTVNVAKFMKNMEATAEAIKEAKIQMARRRKAIEGRVKWLKDYLKDNMEACGITKIESPWFRLAIQKNPAAVSIVDEEAVPDKFKEEILTVKIDKTEIKNALKGGGKVPGAMLVQGTRLVVR